MEPPCPNHNMLAEQMRRSEMRQDATDDKMDTVEKCTIQLTEIIKNIAGRVDGLEPRVSALELKPANRWDSVVGYVLAALVGTIITLLLTGIIRL